MPRRSWAAGLLICGAWLALATDPPAQAGPQKRKEPDRSGPRAQDQPDEALRYRLLDLRDENGVVPANGLVEARRHIDRMRAEREASLAAGAPEAANIASGSWTWLGPGNVGGRLRAILVHPTTPTTMWVGSVGGGIWKTTNGGTSWSPVDDFMANLAVSSLVMDPTNSSVIYAGTGEGFFNVDAIQGAGVFKSTDGGTTWSQLSSTANSSFFYVNRLAIAPSGAALLAATNSGIFRSTNGGASWTQAHASRTLDVDFDPTDSTRAIAGRDNGTALYSTNGGATWTVASGLATGARVEVAYAPSAPATTYASVNTSSGQVWKSTNGGQSYSLVNTGTNYLGAQGWYDNVVWVSPTDSSFVIVGGVDLWKSTNGGTSLTKISRWQSGGGYGPSAHADQHVIVAHPGFNGSSNKTVFFGNDGGIYKANDVTTVGNNADQTAGWTELNNNLGVTQFYGAAGHAGTGKVLGGTQDNGTPVYFGGTETWSDMFGGDGGWCAADPTDANYVYGEYVYLRIHRSTTGGAPFSASEINSGISDANTTNANFIAPFILDPNNPNTMLGGGGQLWRSTNVKAGTPAWVSIKATIGSPISAIAVAPGNSNIVWVGHNNGNVYKTGNGTSTTPSWTQVDTNPSALPNRKVTRITIDPADSNTAYVTFGGFSPDNVYRTTDGGSSWADRTGAGATGLPDIPIRSLVVHPDNSQWIYAGGESGVFASEDAGATWYLPHDSPANVSVDELFILNNATRDLLAATHGRGLYKQSTALPASSVTLAFTSAAQTVAESGSATATVRVTTGNGQPTGAQVQVNYATANGTAAAGSDYASVSGTLTVPAGTVSNSTADLVVSILPDTLDEADETFTIQLSAPSGPGAVLGTSTHTVTITDNDAPPSLSIADVVVSEPASGSTNAAFTVSLSTPSGQAVSVDYATANGTATAATNPTLANNAGITILSTSTNQPATPYPSTISVTGQSGTIAKATVTLTGFSHTWPADLDFLLVGPAGQKLLLMSDVGGGTDANGVNLVFDDDGASLSSAALASGTYKPTNLPPDSQEADDSFPAPAPAGPYGSLLSAFNGTSPNGTWSLYIVDDFTDDQGSIQAWSLTLQMSGGDYAPRSGTLTIPAGSASGAVEVPVLADATPEAPETFVVNLSSPVNATLLDSQGQGTINDGGPPPTLSINDVAVAEGNAGTVNASFTVTLSAASGQTVTVNYATADGTATAPGDYTAIASTTLTFLPGVTTQPVTVVVNGDTLDEPNETFFVNLSGATNATIADTQGQGTITDDDAAPTLSINDVTVTEGNSGTVNAVFTVTLSAASGQTVTVNHATANGTAVAPSDYTAIASGTLTFTPGVTTQPVTVVVQGDLLDEPNETFLVNLSGAVNATIADSQGIGTITDDDVPPTLSINDVAVTEGNAGSVNATFTVSLSAPSGQTVTVNYATADGTATAPGDYTAIVSGTLTFTPGVTTQPVTVVVQGDLLDEPNETFLVNLSGAVNASIADSQGIGTITDDDVPPPSFSLSIDDVAVTEGSAGTLDATFTVTLSPGAVEPVSVNYATANATATAPADYTAVTPGTLTFPAGTLTRTITVAVKGDTADEPNEAFLVVLSSPSSNATIAKGTGQGTILDDDGRPSSCKPIGYVPFTIAGSGSYCLAQSLSYASASGAAITITADDVQLDLNGFTLDGSAAGASTQAYGVHALNRSGLRIRRGTILGFARGVFLDDDSGSAANASGNEVRWLRLVGNTQAGIWVVGQGTTARSNAVVATGGAGAAAAWGISVTGPLARVLDNDVVDVTSAAAGAAIGLQLASATGSVVERNRVGNTAAAAGQTAILLSGGADLLLLKNRIHNASSGIVWSAAAGKYQGNLATGCATPYSGGTDAGNNY